MVTICEGLLQEPMIEEAIRVGDCLALMVEFYHTRGKMREAYAALKEFEHRRLPPEPYLNRPMLETIYKAVGERLGGAPPKASVPTADEGGRSQVEHKSPGGGGARGGHQDDDELEEELEEEIDEIEEDMDSPNRNRGGYGHK